MSTNTQVTDRSAGGIMPCARVPSSICTLLGWLMVCALCGRAGDADRGTPRFGVLEKSLVASGKHDHPYRTVRATARFQGPDNRRWEIPLFWDGGQVWRFRVSPDAVGRWSWQIAGNDPGLDGRSGQFSVVASSRSGGILPMKKFPHHFQRQSGQPFWFFGDTAWALYTDDHDEKHNLSAVQKYIDTRAAQGFNVVHSMLISEAGWGNSGGPPFHDLGAQRINPGYWQQVDRRLAYLNGRGITGGLVLAWGNKGRREKYPWNAFADLDAKQRYARYVAARYAAYDVYFIVSGEWHAEIRTTPGATQQSVKREFDAIGDELIRHDPHGRMVAIHPMTAAGSTRDFNDTRWMAFADYQQNYRDLHGRVLLSRTFAKPVVNSEYAYYLRDRDENGRCDKPNSADLDMIRHATWDVVMAGGYLVTGFGSTYFGGNRHPGPFDVDDPRNDGWESQVQHVRSLLTGLQWWRLAPKDALIKAPLERSADRRAAGVIAPPETAYWVLGDPGRQYVVYVRGCDRPLQLRLGNHGRGAYQWKQLDPRTGELSRPAAQRRDTHLEYTPPDARDWVLVLTARTKDQQP